MTDQSRPEKPKRLSWDLLAEERIKNAQAEGQFDNLPGFGQPIPGIDEPHDELWWGKDKLKREKPSSLPPALHLRLDVEKTLRHIASVKTESEVRQAVLALNERICNGSLGVAWGPPVDVVPLDLEQVVREWRGSSGNH